MTNRMFKGTGVALVTPFLNGKVDFDGLKAVIEHDIKGGVEFLVSLGTTGESATLSTTEKREVLNFTIKTIDGRVPLVAGFGGYNTQTVIDSIKAHDFRRIDAILSVSPAYNKPTQEGIFQHFMAIEAASPVPIILYNVPSRTGSNMTAETTLRLAHASDKFIAVKEASGNLAQCMTIAKYRPNNFLLLSGDDNLTLPMMAFGADGVISVVANAYPRAFSDLIRAGLAGDFKTATDLQFNLMEIVDLLFVDGNPAGVKGALAFLGICSKEVRLPLVELREETYRKLKTLTEQLFEIV